MYSINTLLKAWTLISCLSLLALSACLPESSTQFHDNSHDNFNWNVRDGLPLPLDNPDNPATEAKFQLGRHLFYDKRLSGNGSLSCSSCHQQDKAFSDGIALPTGSTGETLARNSQSLVNVSYNASYTWANLSLVRLEQQALIPLFGESPVEQGINDSNQDEVLTRIATEPTYATLFRNAYGNVDSAINLSNIVDAIAVFVRGINSFNSPYDHYLEGDNNAISESAKRGAQLFFTERLECFHCHGGYTFSDSVVDRSVTFFEKPFHNTGLYNIDSLGSYPPNNTGLNLQTGLQKDMGKFKAPSLRNVALTAPYTHDGSVATLEEMIRIYAAGGRVIESGPYSGDGRDNPYKDGLITGFEINDEEVDDLVNFLNALTDTDVTTNERFSNPWE